MSVWVDHMEDLGLQIGVIGQLCVRERVIESSKFKAPGSVTKK